MQAGYAPPAILPLDRRNDGKAKESASREFRLARLAPHGLQPRGLTLPAWRLCMLLDEGSAGKSITFDSPNDCYKIYSLDCHLTVG